MNDTSRDLVGIADDDLDVATSLRAAFEPLGLERDVDEITALDPAPGSDAPLGPARRRRARWLVGAAAAVAAVTVVGVAGLPGSAPSAWAATPTPVSDADAAKATAPCAAVAAARPGPAEAGTGVQAAVGASGSGSAASSGGSVVEVPVGSSGPVSVGAQEAQPAGSAAAGPGGSNPAPPTTLPPLAVVDRRGDHALAVFEDATWSFACMLRIDGDTWTAEGLMVGPAATSPGQPVATSGMVSAEGAGGSASSSVVGTVPAGVTRVTLTFADGTVAEATVAHGHYAAWYPGDLAATPPVVTQYDASGHQV